MNRKMKKQKRNGPKVNKFDPDGNKAKKAVAELDREDKKRERQSPSPEPIIFSESDLNYPTRTYSCIAHDEMKTIRQARDCYQYSPPYDCESAFNNSRLCSVIMH